LDVSLITTSEGPTEERLVEVKDLLPKVGKPDFCRVIAASTAVKHVVGIHIDNAKSIMAAGRTLT
jgi:hypothetical protein